ncbi:membrane transporter [Schizosaccharomyces octosporus yFS286]|uniref:Membrane transporter n=1 Tax=Schizosaccharomyces octosporus (strain yFS286) TaxID=483514 RepID=S9RB68_SCHOY|nr:membrane transporter [Schizosaccharomyces octosporus yFS286]EPX75385.1 membrane transporter [Schizosaccharomyces octosporus yFS286]
MSSEDSKDFNEKIHNHDVEIGVGEIQQIDELAYTEEEERKLVKKIDLLILPSLCLIFFAQYLDKQSITYTSVFGLKTDLHMTGNQYSWCSTGFYLCQMITTFIFIYLMTKVNRTLLIGVSVVAWGVCCTCLGATHNYAQFIAVRCLLGATEAACQPCTLLVTQSWYRKKEHPYRMAAWISMNSLAQIFGSFFMYGIGKTNKSSLADWKIMFLICGIISIVIGTLFVIAVPFTPEKAWFLTDRERKIALHRIYIESDRQGGSQFSKEQMFECLKCDWLTWSSFAFGFLVCVTSGTIVFQSLILNDFGYDKFQVMIYGSPSGAVQLAFVWIGVFMVMGFSNYRTVIAQLLIIVPIVGNALLLGLPSKAGWGIVVSSWLGSVITCSMSILLSLNASNIRGNTKKSIANNLFFVGYCLAAVVYPQWWDYSKDPKFRVGLAVNLALWCLLEILLVYYRCKALRENKKRSELEKQEDLPIYSIYDDVTDKQDLRHRYSC